MVKEQVEQFFKNKDFETPITDRLILAGYKQKQGGYIKYAKQCGIKHPSQYWHLIHSWCRRSKEQAKFNKRIQCGELIFWMAEVSNAVEPNILNQLADDIINNYLKNRREGNRYIQSICFDNIVRIVEKQCPLV